MKTLPRLHPLLLMALLLPASGQAAPDPDGYWTPDAITGCQIWTAKPAGPEDIASWSGGCVDNQAQGHGVLSWFTPEGLLGRYTGAMAAGRATGLAVLYYRAEDGYDRYQGRFENGRLRGPVILQRADGDRLEGRFSDGHINGYGSWTSSAGDRYDGEFVANRPDGVGYAVSADGEAYHGGFKAGERDGEGVLIQADGGVYEGEFANDKPNGSGRFTAANGDIYSGQFAAGRPLGAITLTRADGSSEQQQWVDGEPTQEQQQ